MDQFLSYLLHDLEDQIKQLKEEAYEDNPSIDRVDYHHEKAQQIVQRIKALTVQSGPQIVGLELVGGKRFE